MANESQKEFLLHIRDFSNQKTHGERKLTDLKKRTLDLTSDLESANSDLELAKQSREMAEQELKGTQVRLAMTNASIQALEARVRNLQEEISRIGSELSSLKNKEDAEREVFKVKMLEMNARIRKFQEIAAQSASRRQSSELPLSKGESTGTEHRMLDSEEESVKVLDEKLKDINAEMQMLEAEYQKQLNDHSEVTNELGNLRRKRILVEAFIQESKIMQELRGQTAELERQYASFGEELQRRYACPSCGFNNMPS